jgi:hypothetical protein
MYLLGLENAMTDFSLFFYYKNRNKIRNSFLLESISVKLKTIILLHYKEENYKIIDNFIRLIKLLAFSLIYFVIIISLDLTYDSLHLYGYGVFVFVGFFIALLLLSYNRTAFLNLDKDHYFRMLSENRNALLRQITLKRINYGFLNWLIPLSLPLFFYASIYTGFHFFITYSVMLGLYYLFLYLIVFSTQKLMFKHLKKTVIIGDVFVYLFSLLIVGLSIGSHIVMLSISTKFEENVNPLITYSILSVIILAFLVFLARYIKRISFNYSITNAIKNTNMHKYKMNRLKTPPFFIRLFYGKDDFTNVILTKDLLSFYRRDKRETFTLIIITLLSLFYSGFVVSSLQDKESILSIIAADNVFLTVIMIIFVIALYRYKNFNWYSGEGINHELFRRLNYKPLKLYKSKVKLNFLILMPMILLYAIAPLFFVFTYSYSGVAYALIRVFLIAIYAFTILEYVLINDARKTIVESQKDSIFMGPMDLSMFIFFVQGIGLTALVTIIPENSLLSGWTFIYWIVLGLFVLGVCILQFRFHLFRKSFSEEEV